jgi:hypothetical protein
MKWVGVCMGEKDDEVVVGLYDVFDAKGRGGFTCQWRRHVEL